MPIAKRLRSTLWALACTAGLLLRAAPEPPALPPIMLWAWERAEDLRFLDTREAGVAFLARTVFLEGARVRVRSRRNPLRLPPGIARVAVVRIEVRRPALTPAQAERVVLALADLWRLPEVRGLQMDFDARAGERPFYRDLLARLRRALPPRWSLGITALGSWCLGDPWIRDLPVDEAIPMLFRMGPEGPAIRRILARGTDFSVAQARTSLGLCLDEPLPRLPPGRRIYLFPCGPWTAASYRTAKGRINR